MPLVNDREFHKGSKHAAFTLLSMILFGLQYLERRRPGPSSKRLLKSFSKIKSQAFQPGFF